MIEKIDAELARATQALSGARSEREVEAVRVEFLGKSGSLSGLRKGMGAVPAADRPKIGKLVTDAIARVEGLIDEAKKAVARRELEKDLHREKLDVSLPGRTHKRGHRHPVSQAFDDIVEIFARLGFHLADGPEIEWDLYNFEKLGFPPDHPARDMQDTFFIEKASQPPPPPGSPPTKGAMEQLLLRTHTSPVQIRTMIGQPPPVRIIAPGKVYRSDSDITHTPMFHQVECLHVEKGLSMAHLRGTLDAFAKAFFGPTVQTRLRPSYFPFTEPSAEVDVSHTLCDGRGCKICKYSGWLEILGSGMVNPDVLANVGYDPEQITGYAFGVGIDRLAMLRHGIDDLRALFENDTRFLEQL
ncbi:MAG: phenylalanine--tRNA ligase subunit alpha [Myxococcales bacterium]|nr:phenylalanine--tRNA ligase subunit alpha [Myxococcales bacterium]